MGIALVVILLMVHGVIKYIGIWPKLLIMLNKFDRTIVAENMSRLELRIDLPEIEINSKVNIIKIPSSY